MSIYRIGQHEVDATDPRLLPILASAHAAKVRPLCGCKHPGVPMYIAHVADQYLVKRMPDSGSHHDPVCESYEPPEELSGLGDVTGKAIQEDIESGSTALKFDFALSKAGRRPAPAAGAAEPDSVRTDGSKLSLRAALHYLWEQAGLNKWTPAMASKRSWYVVRKYLLQAAEQKVVKGGALAPLLYIPEAFSVDHKAEIVTRRTAHLSKIAPMDKGARKLMILVAEVKEICPARYGFKLIAKHVPDMHFMLAEDVHSRMEKRFENELALWNADETTHLMVIATFGMTPAGVVSIEELSLMLTSPTWIPIEHAWDEKLVEALTWDERRFTKGLRYNLSSDRPLACAVLADAKPRPVALYIVSASASDIHRQALRELIEDSQLAPWIWKASDEPMPMLPPMHGYVPAASDIDAVRTDEAESVGAGPRTTEDNHAGSVL